VVVVCAHPVLWSRSHDPRHVALARARGRTLGASV